MTNLDLITINKWDGVTGSGQEARAAINTNFQKTKEAIEEARTTEHVYQSPDWNVLFSRNGYFVFADDVRGENRPDGLPVPEGEEVIYYNVVSAGKNSIDGHNQPTLILQRHGTLEVYFVSMGDDSILAAIRVVDAGELVTAMQSINNAFSSLDQVIEDITTELGGKASEEDLEDAVDRIVELETLQQTEHVYQSPDWNVLFSRNGYFVFADDVRGENRPDGLPVPEGEEVIYYNVVSAGKNDVAGHNQPTLILQRHGTLEVYFVSKAEDNIVTATRVVDAGELESAIQTINNAFSSLDQVIEGITTELGGKASEEDLEDAVDRIVELETLQQTEHVYQSPDWNVLFSRNGYFVFADDVRGENRPDGLPVPEGEEVIYYNVVSAGKNGISGHDNPTLILQRHGTMEVYFVSMGDDSILAAIRIVDAGELESAIQSINNAFSIIDQAIEGMATELGGKASDEDLGNAVDRIETLETLQQTEHVYQNPDWSTLFTRNGYFVFADDVTGENRPDGLPVPVGEEVIYYNVVSAGKNGISGHDNPTLILQRHGTMEVYFVSMGNDSILAAIRIVDAGDLGSVVGDIDTILDILNGDLEADIQEVLDNMSGI